MHDCLKHFPLVVVVIVIVFQGAGAAGAWSGNPIGDHISTNRISEWSAMRNGHMVFRQLLSTFVLGATWFRSDVTIPYRNPLYLRGDTDDPKLQLGSGYRQGIVPFLRLVEAGVFPSAPVPSQLKGLSPVAIAIPNPNPCLDVDSQSKYFLFNVCRIST